MTATKTSTSTIRRPALERDTAIRLATTEYERYVRLLHEVSPEQWGAPTDCPDWDVHAMATHVLGMAEMSASLREQVRQLRAARKRGGLLVDALNAVQVDAGRGLEPATVVQRLAATVPRAVRGRERMPGLVRRSAMPGQQQVGAAGEVWTFGFLTDVVLTRDVWMHRIDTARATGLTFVVTPDHDGAIVADLVAEWAERHGRAYVLRLTGPAGGEWSAGDGGDELELDAVEFGRLVSGRGSGEGLLARQVAF